MIKEAIVLAGGLGTRLQGVINDVPKPMAPVKDKPFLEYVLAYLKHYAIQRVVLSVGYKANSIVSYFGDSFKTMDLVYSNEKEPLGTGGAILQAFNLIQEPEVFVLNGDTFFPVNLGSLHRTHQMNGSLVTFSLKSMKQSGRYGTVNLNQENRITGFNEKGQAAAGLINGGVYLFEKKVADQFPSRDQFSIEKDFFEPAVSRIPMYGHISDTYFIDIGIPEDYYKANIELEKFIF